MSATRASPIATGAAAPRVRLPVPGLARALALVPQLSRYTLVSAVALGLDFAVFLALAHGAGLKASSAGAIGYSAGLLLHFALSSRFVFDTGSTRKSRVRLFCEFAASGLVGVAITAAVIALAVDVAGLLPVIGKAIAVAVSFASVFVLRRTIVFATASPVTARPVTSGP